MNHSTYLKIVRLAYTHADGTHALHMQNVTIPCDAITVISGRNGAGKSLLALALCGLLPRADIILEHHHNQAITRFNSKSLRQNSGIVFQNSEHQIIGQTVADDIAFGLKNLRTPPAEIAQRVHTVMKSCDLSHLATRHPLSLSGGEMRRVAIAAMLVLRPKVLILDEPFSSLDWHAQQQLSALIVAIHQEGVTPIIITHNLPCVHTYVRWMLVLHNGTIAAADTPQRALPCAIAHRIIGGDLAHSLTWH